MRVKSLAFRLVTGAGLWIIAALVAGGLLLSAVFRESAERAFDARLRVLLDALVAASYIDDDGNLTLSRAPGEPRFEQPYSGWYWQVSADKGPILRSRSLWDQVLSPDFQIRGSSRFQVLGPQRQELRMVAREVTLPGSDETYRFTVTGDRAEVDREIQSFNETLIWSLGGLGLGLIVALLIQVRYGLQPLRRVRAALADVSSGRADRLRGNFPAEVEPLAHEINVLLDNNAHVVERARTHVGNLAHALKTPISVLSNVATDPREDDPDSLKETVQRQLGIMRRHVDHYLVRARAAASGDVLGARTEVRGVADDLARTLQRIHAGRGIQIAVTGHPGIHFRGERQDLEEMLGNLMDNACKWASSRVQVAVGVADGRLTVTVEDDGPGLSAEEREAAFGRGKRLDEATPGSGLGLSIVRDVAELYDGEVALERSRTGGVRAVLALPAADSRAA